MTRDIHNRPTHRSPKLSQHARRRAIAAALEPLEPRQLLTVDLSGAFATVPADAVVGGSRQAAVLSIANNGDTRFFRGLQIDVYAVRDGDAFDPDTSTSLGRFTRTVNVPAGTSRDVTLQVPVDISLAAGGYHFVAVLDPNNRITETDETNNVATSDTVTITQPNFDILPTFSAGTSLRRGLVSGTSSNGSVQLVLTNPAESAVRLPARTQVGVQVVARPVGAVDASQDILLNRTTINGNVGNLAPGQSRTVNVPIQFPATLVNGDYAVVALVDTGGAVAETSELNNTVIFPGNMVTVADPFADLGLTLNSASSLPTSVAADNRPLPLQFDITNNGNVSVAPGQFGTLTLVAHDLTTDQDFALQTLNNVALSGLTAGQTRTITVNPAVASSLPNGQFDIRATLTSGVATDLTLDNSLSLVSSGFSPLTVAPPNIDFAPTITGSTFGTTLVSGAAQSGIVTVDVGNVGNVNAAAAQRANVTVALRPVGAVDNTQDILIGTARSASLANLAAGAGRTVNVRTAIPANLANGEFNLVTTVRPIGTLIEGATDNNVFVTQAPLGLSSPFVNLNVASATTSFTGAQFGGATGVGSVTLSDLGNIAAKGNVTVQFFASPTGNIADATLVGSSVVPVNLLPGQTSTAFDVPVTLPTVAATGNYTLFAKILGSGVRDTVADDDLLPAGNVTLSSDFVDLLVSSASNPFSGTALGSATGTGLVTLQNIGNVAGTGDVTVTYYLSPTTTIDASAIPIGATTLSNFTLGAGTFSTPATVNLTLPNPTLSGNYNVLANISATGNLNSILSNDNTAVLGTLTILPI
jgi:hypothetical protein